MKNKATSLAYTPGPWKIACDSYGKVRHSRMACVYRSVVSEPLTTVAQRIKNWDDARLIAAAPQMLDVLTMAKEQCERLPDDAATDCLVQAIDEVIAKAKGKAA